MEVLINENTKYLVCGFLGSLVGVFMLLSFQYLSKAHAQPVPIEKPPITKKKRTLWDDFFSGSDPFQSMGQFHHRLFEDVAGFDIDFPQLGQTMEFPKGQTHYQVEERETENHLIYEVTFHGEVDNDSVNVSVRNGLVTLSGEKQIKKENDGSYGQSFFSSRSSFVQSFSVPPGVDEENVVMENDNNKLLIKFPKLQREV